MTESRDLVIARAIRDIIVPTNVTPNAALETNHGVSIGDTTVWVPDALLPRLAGGMQFTYYDATDEEEIPIDGLWDGTNPVTFDWAHMDYSGFRRAHPEGTLVGSNLFYADAPWIIDGMSDTDEKLVFITVVHETLTWAASLMDEPDYQVRIEVRRRMVRPSAGGSNPKKIVPNVWVARVRKEVRETLEIIMDILKDHWRLTTDEGGDHALSIGERDNLYAPVYSKDWTSFLMNSGDLYAKATGILPVRGFWLPRKINP